MIRTLTYSKGKVKEVDFSKVNLKNSKAWINCDNIKLKDLREIADKTKIPLFELKHALDTHETPRISNKKNYSLIIFRAVYPDADKKITHPVEFIITKNFLITLVAEESKAIENTFDNRDASFWKEASKEGFGILIYKILLAIIRNYESYLEEFDDQVDELEDNALHGKDEDIHKLIDLKKKLLFLKRSLSANKEVLDNLGDNKLSFLDFSNYIHDIHIEFAQMSTTAESVKDRVTSTTEIFVSSVSNKLNKIMKSFTIIASILLLPTLIAGIYGMNIALPFAKNPQAFVIVIGIMIVSVLLMLTYFKEKKWL